MNVLTETVESPTAVPFVTLRFPIVEGRQLPADHGFALYSAISRLLPILHESADLGIELISGVPWQKGIIALATQGAVFSLRLPAQECAQALPLAGKRLEIAGQNIRLGIPRIELLAPAPELYARIVIIKKFTEAEPFLAAAERQLAALNITAKLEIPGDGQGRPRRRVMRVHGKALIGFSLVARGLSDDNSILLQSRGLGGKRHMGCGIFNPVSSSLAAQLLAEEKA
jgi:CRISPR-associated protein Cas6